MMTPNSRLGIWGKGKLLYILRSPFPKPMGNGLYGVFFPYLFPNRFPKNPIRPP